jgi:iron complex transport system ATP-binding protein
MTLEAIDLGFGYPQNAVGRGASLEVAVGETLCLLGPNGCGKTTLFKTLLGLLRLQAGRVTLDGRDIARVSRADLARRIAYVPQAQAMPFPYRTFDTVLMGRIAHRGLFAGPAAQDRVAAMRALAELGIEDLANVEVTRISGGQRQLVLIARAMAQAAPFIVMDEPTASLDFGNQVRVLQEIRKLSARGSGVILSTHDPDHAFAVADRVILMRNGALAAVGTPADVMTASNLREIYNVDVAVETLPSGATVCVPKFGAAFRASASSGNGADPRTKP